MKVAFIYLGRRGGGPVYSLEIAKRLAKQTDLLAIISKQTENLGYWRKSDISVSSISTYSNSFQFLFSFLNFRKFIKISKQIKDFSPDVIYYPFFHFWIPIINFLLPNIPKVYTSHDPVLHRGEYNLLMEIFQNSAIKKSKRVIVLSKVFRNLIHKKNKIPLEDIDVIPHGVFNHYSEISNFETINKEKIPHAPTILFFGRIIKYKGLDILLRAFPLIKREIPGAKLLIVGDGDLSPYKKILANLKDITIKNRWIKDNEVAKFFYQSDISVCPYIEASQSGVIPLAYSFKMPVVASEVDGLKEQVDNNLTGFLVSPKNHVQLAKVCTLLLKDDKKRKSMGENGYKKANEEWSWDKISEMVLESLKKSIN